MVQTMCGRMALAFAGNAGDLRLECVVEKGVGKVGAGGTRQYVRQRAVVGDSTVVQEVEPVAKVLRFAHDMRRDQHGPPGGALAADGFREEPSADHVERSGGFVQQEHAGLMEEGPGDIGALLLSAGQRAAEAVSEGGDFQLLHQAARRAHTARSSPSADVIATARSVCRTPVTPCSMTSIGPATGKAATGTPHARASII